MFVLHSTEICLKVKNCSLNWNSKFVTVMLQQCIIWVYLQDLVLIKASLGKSLCKNASTQLQFRHLPREQNFMSFNPVVKMPARQSCSTFRQHDLSCQSSSYSPSILHFWPMQASQASVLSSCLYVTVCLFLGCHEKIWCSWLPSFSRVQTIHSLQCLEVKPLNEGAGASLSCH